MAEKQPRVLSLTIENLMLQNQEILKCDSQLYKTCFSNLSVMLYTKW